MELGLAGKRALITGGSRGIGLACAHALAAEGVHLAIAAREVDPLKTATRELRDSYDVDVTSHSCNLARTEHQAALIDVVGAVDLLINNAGAIPSGDIQALDDKEWRAAWDIKVFAYINLCRLVLPMMTETGSGVIINIMGPATDRSPAEDVAAVTGNAALVAMTEALGSASRNDGVRVVGVNPGLTLTDRMEQLLRDRAERTLGNPDRWVEMVPTNPAPASVDQVADIALFLASDRAAHVTGTTLTVDGGNPRR